MSLAETPRSRSSLSIAIGSAPAGHWLPSTSHPKVIEGSRQPSSKHRGANWAYPEPIY
jgi:hypothetical protein